jgi:hypothetical protein
MGVSLLDADLDILMETTVSFAPDSRRKKVLPEYNDYRIYNLHDDLYLTSMNRIVPLYLTMTPPPSTTTSSGSADATTYQNHKINNSTILVDSLIEMPPAFPSSATLSSPPPPFRVWIRNFAACPVDKANSKNLLYFVSKDTVNDQDTNKTNNVRVIHYPSRNPNDVRHVQLNTPCGEQPISPIEGDANDTTPEPSFPTIEEQLFPGAAIKGNLFLGDRGSACCTSMTDPTNGEEVLVALVHPKTHFPGKRLPKGVVRNTYLSRWIAFQPQSPYRIVARSGMFCLGYPTELDQLTTTVDASLTYNNNSRPRAVSYQNPLSMVHLDPLSFAGKLYNNCPRIHFVMGMVAKVNDPSKVLVSYGVSDCLSRIIEISKKEIQSMLWP